MCTIDDSLEDNCILLCERYDKSTGALISRDMVDIWNSIPYLYRVAEDMSYGYISEGRGYRLVKKKDLNYVVLENAKERIELYMRW